MLGCKIKNCRIKKGLTQQTIADKVGVDVTTISKIENDKASPSLKTLLKIATVLDVEVEYLLNTA